MERKYKEDQFLHRLVEKKRRDRINRCLFDLSLAVPAEFTQKKNGKLEKAEILEMTVMYLKVLEAERNNSTFEQDAVSRAFKEGYKECMDVVRLYFQTNLGQRCRTRSLMLLQYLQSRCSVKFSQIRQNQISNHQDNCLQQLGQHDDCDKQQPGELGYGDSLSVTGYESIPTEFKYANKRKILRLMEFRTATKRSWDDEFEDLKKSLFRK